jgi:CubicO group peptidase (beta-lactamase class C family)
MRRAVGVVRRWELTALGGDRGLMNAASLMKQVVGHLAVAHLDLDTPIAGEITARHVLTHTTGLPNWRSGADLVPVRPPGVRWGYSGEGYVLLHAALEAVSGASIDELATTSLFEPLGMSETRFDRPEAGYHGYRPLMTTARDYGRFLAHVLRVDDERWTPQWPVTDRLAWGLGWGLELVEPIHAWQWGSNPDASNFVIGCPKSGDGVVVFTDSPDGATAYEDVIRSELPGDRPSLDAWSDPRWLELFT